VKRNLRAAMERTRQDSRIHWGALKKTRRQGRKGKKKGDVKTNLNVKKIRGRINAGSGYQMEEY